MLRLLALASVTLALASSTAAQERPVVTAEDYARAERFLAPAAYPLVSGGRVSATWLDDGRFTYMTDQAAYVVDPAAGTRAEAFDADGMARALSAATGDTVEADALPFSTFELAGGGVAVDVGETHYVCDLGAETCTDAGARRTEDPREAMMRRFRSTDVLSPDGSKAAFIRDWNLWVRDVETGEETPLTTDGEVDNGYATDNAGWRKSDRPILKWSPDSRKIATQQQDEREVGRMVLATTNVGRPEVQDWSYPLPGDSAVAMLRRVILEVETGRMIPLDLPPEYHRATLGDDLSMDDYIWSPDGRQLALASTPRDHKSATVRVADAQTGAVRDVLTESEDTHFESVTGWRVLWDTDELVWYSQRDD